MRTYERTHPWLTFSLDLRRASPRLWMLLGEAQSKVGHVAGVSLLPEVAEELHHLYLAKGVHATTAIEGNTLTEEEVRRRIAGDLMLPPAREYLGQEVTNIEEACIRIGNAVLAGVDARLEVSDLLGYNALILRDLPLDEGVHPGEIRKGEVGVAHYRGAPAEDCPYLLERMCHWLNTAFPSAGPDALAYGILKAALAHLYFAWIHPFDDGNGRTARLVEFQLLLAAGAPSNAAHLLSNHYNQTRADYYRQLDRASKSGGDVFPFVEYAVQGFVDGLRAQIETIQVQQLRVHWLHFVYEQFRDLDTPTDRRRRRLVLDLSEHLTSVPFPRVRQVSPRIAAAYAGKTDKTVQRDLNALKDLGLIERTPRGAVRARTELVLAFMPLRRPEIDPPS